MFWGCLRAGPFLAATPKDSKQDHMEAIHDMHHFMVRGQLLSYVISE